jgi:hypothetical protein
MKTSEAIIWTGFLFLVVGVLLFFLASGYGFTVSLSVPAYVIGGLGIVGMAGGMTAQCWCYDSTWCGRDYCS